MQCLPHPILHTFIYSISDFIWSINTNQKLVQSLEAALLTEGDRNALVASGFMLCRLETVM